MGLLIQKTDFTGVYALSQSISDTIDASIEEYEEKYLIDLLGVELFDLFKANVTSYIPAVGIYKTIYDPIREDYGNCIRISQGMKKMLLGFVWFHYAVDNAFKHSGTGIVANTQEIAVQANWDSGIVYKKYNTDVSDYQTIQWYIEKNLSDYPKFNGQRKALNYHL
jgi:hypothetical protein